jgi:hypothetical protein
VASGRLSSLSQAGPIVQAGPLSRFGIRRPRLPSITYLAELTGGFYLCHILFINMIRAALYSGLVGGEHLPWPIRTATFYVGTLVVATTFVSLILRTPLRWVLGGPVRAEQRVRDNAEVACSRVQPARRSGTGGATGTSGEPEAARGIGTGPMTLGVHGPGAPDTPPSTQEVLAPQSLELRGPASPKPWRTPWPARATSFSGSYSMR